jgi:hypothetical protein
MNSRLTIYLARAHADDLLRQATQARLAEEARFAVRQQARRGRTLPSGSSTSKAVLASSVSAHDQARHPPDNASHRFSMERSYAGAAWRPAAPTPQPQLPRRRGWQHAPADPAPVSETRSDRSTRISARHPMDPVCEVSAGVPPTEELPRESSSLTLASSPALVARLETRGNAC